ncbi:heavy metal-binding domain-containing protein [Actinomadura sp. NTSP31]|uniref:heavy metal-binding domain-containing protein n=1 Tax=Actinomadura sp. NTSP31 TaxID=1735447 RepID=UPI0035BFE59E
MIPVFTTDSVPIYGAQPVTGAWPVWAESDDAGRAIDQLARQSAAQGAHAVIGLRLSTFSSEHRMDKYVVMGTAVTMADA